MIAAVLETVFEFLLEFVLWPLLDRGGTLPSRLRPLRRLTVAWLAGAAGAWVIAAVLPALSPIETVAGVAGWLFIALFLISAAVLSFRIFQGGGTGGAKEPRR